LFVTTLKNRPEIDWAGGTKVDLSKATDENYPFELASLGVPKIIFKSIDRWRIDNVTKSPDFNDFTSF
jgi:hypothetical protein